MSDRVCMRGCVLRGRHLVPHSEGESCSGCLPVEAMSGAMLCEACCVRLRRVLNDAPDLVAHLRSMVDPLRSGWNISTLPRQQSGPMVENRTFGATKPATHRTAGSRVPMNTDLIEAADAVLSILTYSATEFGDEMDYSRRRQFEAGTSALEAYDAARMPAWFLLDNLGWIVNDVRVGVFAHAVLGPVGKDEWSIARALGRWPLRDRAKYATSPCPQCKLRMVMVRPPRHAWDRKTYECLNPKCEWHPPASEYADWQDYFEGEVDPWVPERIPVLEGPRLQRPSRYGTVAELQLSGLQRDLRAEVCPTCQLIRPCDCEEVA